MVKISPLAVGEIWLWGMASLDFLRHFGRVTEYLDSQKGSRALKIKLLRALTNHMRLWIAAKDVATTSFSVLVFWVFWACDSNLVSNGYEKIG